jgi:hypothetical protein
MSTKTIYGEIVVDVLYLIFHYYMCLELRYDVCPRECAGYLPS